MAAVEPIAKAYIVQRIGWNYNDEYFYRGEGEEDDTPVKAFRDRARAEAHLRQLHDAEAAKWVGINPFEFGRRLADVTSLSAAELVARVRALGFQPPPVNDEITEGYVWFEWWDEAMAAAVRPLLDRIRFFEIIEVDAEF